MKKLIVLLLLNFTLFIHGQTQNFEAGSKIYITYSTIDGKANMDPSNSIESIVAQLKDKTSLVVVETIDDSDFIAEYSLIKGFADNRHGKLLIKDKDSGEVVFESKLVRAPANAYNGFNPTRGVAKTIVEKHLLKQFPELSW